MNDIPISTLFFVLAVLICLSGFFSGSETALMTFNRYRLRHLAKQGHKGAMRVERLLQQPDRLIGLILLGNNFVNVLASAITTIIALQLLGEPGVAIGAGALTLVLLVFAEVAPKTYAAQHPDRLAYAAAYVYTPMLKLLYPLVWSVNLLANCLLTLLGLGKARHSSDNLSREELRTLVNETSTMIPKGHQKMLINILDLEKVSVEDIMVPRNEIDGLDIDDDWDVIHEQISIGAHSRLPVYHEDIDNIIGFLHLRSLLINSAANEELNKNKLKKYIQEPYYIPEGTSLTRQLLNFQQHKQRLGLVVDEYGDIQGLVTLEDILEEIVGKFTSARANTSRDIHNQDDDTYIVDGGCHIRDLNRTLTLHIPTDGPKTLNGFILEYLESIPEIGTTFLLENHPVEILQTKGNAVRSVKIYPQLKHKRLSRQVSATTQYPQAVNGR